LENNNMEELLKFIISSILTEKNVAISKEETEDGLITFYIKPNPEDAGILIGKGGKVIKSISQILKIKATLMKKRVILKVVSENQEN
jgi:Predicted RNA-binding protein (contains KH domain)